MIVITRAFRSIRPWVVTGLVTSGCAAWQPPGVRGVVAIDPGHPSETSSGAEVQNGTTEVHVAWLVALELEAELTRRGFRVVMTKSREEQLVRNADRASIGNRVGAALMVRLHLDASTDSGFAIYYPDRRGTAEGRSGPPADVRAASRVAAESLHAAMAPALRGMLKDGGVRGDSRTLVGSRQGALTGSIFSEIPVVLVEMATLSNARDAAFMKTSSGRARMARALADGIARYVQTLAT